MEKAALLKKATELFQRMSISKDEAQLIEESTRPQRQSGEWYEQRAGCLTASSFHDVLVQRPTSDTEALTQRLMGYNQVVFLLLNGVLKMKILPEKSMLL